MDENKYGLHGNQKGFILMSNLPIIDPIPNTPAISPPPNKVIERKVYIRVVEDVKEYDFPQAAKAWQALEQAGMDPGELVANALEQGHDYRSNEVVITQPFKEKQIQEMLGETIMEGTRLVSYQYVSDSNLLASPQAQDNHSGGLVVASQKMAVAQETNQKKGVKLTAVLRQKLPDLLK